MTPYLKVALGVNIFTSLLIAAVGLYSGSSWAVVGWACAFVPLSAEVIWFRVKIA